jgi:TonB family protein
MRLYYGVIAILTVIMTAGASFGADRCDFSEYKPLRLGATEGKAIIKKGIPEYPSEAIKRHIEGLVSVQVLYDASGVVRKACVTSGHRLLQDAAVAAALKTLFIPFLLNGKAVPYVEQQISLNFVLQKDSTVVDDSYFPIKTKADYEGVSEFESEWYSQPLKRMNEPRLSTFAKDFSSDIYRITILPTWGNPIAVRVQKHGELFSLSARRLDGQAGYDPGKLVESKDIALGANDSNTLAVLIQNLNFFQMSTEDALRGVDGDQWIAEGVSQGKYHVVVRWCAASYNPGKRKLTAFLDFCKFLLDKSTLSERPRNKGNKLI